MSSLLALNSHFRPLMSAFGGKADIIHDAGATGSIVDIAAVKASPNPKILRATRESLARTSERQANHNRKSEAGTIPHG
jgi:hypothetical protein